MKYILMLFISFASEAQTIYVQASRVETDIDTVTSSTESIDMRNDISSDLSSSPGVFISEQSAYGSASSLKLRGTQRGFSKIMLDDIELSDATDINRSFQLNLINNLYIDSALILKGPQSTHYGSDTIGGVVKLRTDTKKKKSYGLRVSQGSNQYGSLNFNFSKKKKDTSWRILTSYEDTKGISSHSGGLERDFYQNFNFYGVVEQRINSSTKLKYSGLTIKSRQDIDDFGNERVAFDLLKYNQQTHQVKLNKRLMSDRLKTSVMMRRTDIFRKSQGKYPSEQNGGSEQVEVYGLYYLNEMITPSVLINYNKENLTNISDFTNISNRSLESYSFSGNVDLKYGNFSSQLGALYLGHSAFSDLDSSKVGLAYRINSNFRLITNWSRNFILPTVYQVYFSSEDSLLEATLGETLDFGFIATYRKYKFSVTFFDNQFKNQIDYDSSDNRYSNIKESEVRGLEGLVEYKSKRLYANVSTSLLRSTDKSTGKYLGKSPRFISSTTLRYSINDQLQVENSWRYVGERNDSGRMPSYLVGDLHLNFSFFKFSIKNILDKEYENTRTYNTLGRNYLASMTYEL